METLCLHFIGLCGVLSFLNSWIYQSHQHSYFLSCHNSFFSFPLVLLSGSYSCCRCCCFRSGKSGSLSCKLCSLSCNLLLISICWLVLSHCFPGISVLQSFLLFVVVLHSFYSPVSYTFSRSVLGLSYAVREPVSVLLSLQLLSCVSWYILTICPRLLVYCGTVLSFSISY